MKKIFPAIVFCLTLLAGYFHLGAQNESAISETSRDFGFDKEDSEDSIKEDDLNHLSSDNSGNQTTGKNLDSKHTSQKHQGDTEIIDKTRPEVFKNTNTENEIKKNNETRKKNFHSRLKKNNKVNTAFTKPRYSRAVIYFAFGSSRLSKKSVATLTKIKAQKGTTIFIHGYSDSTGSYLSKKRISQKRAQRVLRFLTRYNKGIRFKYFSLADKKPQANNKTKKGRALNRRVVIRYKS